MPLCQSEYFYVKEKKLKLLNLALQAMKNAYVPYSNFRVGVAIKSSRNKYYFGCNVENSAYPQSLCAESGAISSMIAGGCTSISEVLIVSQSENLIVPCGGCRQKLLEFSHAETTVLLANLEGVCKVYNFEELLPFSFHKGYLLE
jgi:cytidine deaminase